MTASKLIDVIRADARRYRADATTLPQLLSVTLRHQGMAATVMYRVARLAASRGDSIAPILLSRLSHHLNHCSISTGAVIAPGLHLPHPDGVIIGAGAVVGGNCTIQQHVTIGGNFDRTVEGRQMPTLEDNVAIATGAVIAGPVRIGGRSIVGANAVVTRDVPSDTVVAAATTRSFPRSGRLTQTTSD